MANPQSNNIDKYGPLIGAIDQGTSSTRFIVFASNTAEVVTFHQEEIKQSFPREGWVEQDPMEIIQSVHKCIEKVTENLQKLDISLNDLKAIGITNQRETTILWDKTTGEPLYNAIVWLDGRTAGTVEDLINRTPGKNKEYLKEKCGLPLSTYFSAVKIKWLMENNTEVNIALDEERCLFGTVDTWLIWNLTGGKDGGIHITDVSNASRTMLMNLETCKWDVSLTRFFGIPHQILPEIKSSSEIYGKIKVGPLEGLPISCCMGDQSAAMVGQMCFRKGMAKNTYGTGCFLMCNTGQKPVFSTHGLLTTIGYKFGKEGTVKYALEGSVAIAGASVRWLRDNLGFLENTAEMESLCRTVKSTYDVYFVPAFSGLYAPYWDPNARGLIIGLTQYTTKAHIALACLEAICYETKEIAQAMDKDMDHSLESLQVDGGMCANNLLMQLQSNILGIPIVRPSMAETSALGAAMAAGFAAGIDCWNLDETATISSDVFTPKNNEYERTLGFSRWKQAVHRSMGWALTDHNETADRYLGSNHLP